MPCRQGHLLDCFLRNFSISEGLLNVDRLAKERFLEDNARSATCRTCSAILVGFSSSIPLVTYDSTRKLLLVMAVWKFERMLRVAELAADL